MPRLRIRSPRLPPGTRVIAVAMGRRRVHWFAAPIGALLAGVFGVALLAGHVSGAGSPDEARRAVTVATPAPPSPSGLTRAASVSVVPLAANAGRDPLRAHELFGFAPYWTLDGSAGFDLTHLTTIAYFGLDLGADGTVDTGSSGGDAWTSQQLADLVGRAHAVGVRVVLTVTQFDDATLHALITDPAAQAAAVQSIGEAVRSHHLDGVNLDLEGTRRSDRDGFTHLVSVIASGLRMVDPAWQVTVDTYLSSAGDTGGFMDAGSLGRLVDAVVVMGYSPHPGDQPAPAASLGDERAGVVTYLGVLPASSVILAIPLYGNTWAVDRPGLGASAIDTPTASSYTAVRARETTRYWDGAASVPWTQYQEGGTWYQTYYEDPQSVGLKARIGIDAGLRGVGIWALGMDGNDAGMGRAVLGTVADLPDVPPPTAAPATPTIPASPTIAPHGLTPAPPAPTAVTTRPPVATPQPTADGGTPFPAGFGTSPSASAPTSAPPSAPGA